MMWQMITVGMRQKVGVRQPMGKIFPDQEEAGDLQPFLDDGQPNPKYRRLIAYHKFTAQLFELFPEYAKAKEEASHRWEITRT